MDIGIVVTAINNATASLKGVANDIGLIGDKSQETANRLKAIQVVIAGIALEKGLEFGKKFLEAAASVQNMQLRVAAWAGGMKQGQQVLEDFKNSLAASGVKMESTADAFSKLRASGVNSAQAVETIKHLVDGIAAVGGGDLDGKLAAAATAFQRFASKGQVSTRELNAIISDTGITIQELADSSGVSLAKFRDELKNKMTSAQTFLDAFNKAAQEKFGGFATLLGSTVGGSLNKFKIDIEEAIGALGSKTTLNAGIAVLVQEIDKAVVSWIGHIKQADIDHFFEIIKALGPLALEVAQAIGMVAQVVGFVGEATINLLNHMPSEAVEFGMIGYFLLGKKGAALGALIGTIAEQLPKLESTTGNTAASFQQLQQKGGYQGLLDYNNAQDPNSPLTNMFKSAGEYAEGAFFEGLKGLGDMFHDKVAVPLAHVAHDAGTLAGTNQATGFLDGFDKKVKAIQDALAKIGKTKFNAPGGLPPPPGPNQHDISAQLAALEANANKTIGSVTESDQLLRAKNAGDQLAIAISQIFKETSGWNDQLAEVQTKLEHSKLPHAEIVKYDQQIASLETQIAKDTQDAIDRATKLVSLKNEQYVIEQRIQMAQLAQTEYQNQLDKAQLSSSGAAFLSGFSGTQAAEQAIQQKLQYYQQALQYQQQINALTQDQQNNAGNTAQVALDQAHINALNSEITLTEQLSQATTAAAILQRQYYQELANVLENDVANGISGVIKGTETWQQAAQSLFGDLIDMTVKYILKLIELQIFGEIAGQASLAASAPVALAQQAIWAPAAISASIATFGAADAIGVAAYQASLATSVLPFADGGIPPSIGHLSGQVLTGPTLFGLAGEAGSEAVMPLTRVGGKLGVRAEGAGGDHYHLSIHAIDPSSGLQFVHKHIDDIDGALAQRKRLNRSVSR